MTMEIQGDCPAGLGALRDVLADEQRSGRALGQAIAVVVDDETVAHLWCGHADSGRTREWTPQTLVCLFSASKPLAAACVLKLLERGGIELEAPITSPRSPHFPSRTTQAKLAPAGAFSIVTVSCVRPSATSALLLPVIVAHDPWPMIRPPQSSPCLVGDSMSRSTSPVASFVAVRTHAVAAKASHATAVSIRFRMRSPV